MNDFYLWIPPQARMERLAGQREFVFLRTCLGTIWKRSGFALWAFKAHLILL